MTTIGVDVGGTKILAALVGDDHVVRERAKVATPEGGADAIVAAIVEAVGRLGSSASAVGVGVPGPVHGGVLMAAPNLPHIAEPLPVGALLGQALGVPVAVGNDANVGTYGEWVAGAGRGARHVLGVWLGTGVGGGLVLDGRPFVGANGGAGEFGHVIVRQGGALCGCGRRGCVEAYAGRAAMERAARAAVANGATTALPLEKSTLKSGAWADALAADDQLAEQLLAEAVAAVAAGVASAANLLDLDRVVLGGGLAEKLGQPLADRIDAATRPLLLVPKLDPVAVAALGDDSGVVGAAALARG